MKTEFDYPEFKKIVKVLKKSKIDYYIFGGYFIDAILKEKHKHDDLDIIINLKDKDKLIDSLKKIGYSSKKTGRMLEFEKKSVNKKYKIGIFFIRKLKNVYRIRGNRSEEVISAKAFEKTNYLKTGSIKFKTMPFEWFLLYQKISHYDKKKRKRHKKAMMDVTPFCKKLKVLKHKPIKRLKSDPKFKK